MKSRHTHPNPRFDRLTQYGALLLIVVMSFGAAGQLILAAVGAPGGLFVLTALLTLLLIPFVLRVTAATPPVTVSHAGLLIEPLVWKARFIGWGEVRAMKDYTLLPDPGAETGRSALVGRRRYRRAEGRMLVIPTLPLQYRITGLLAGEGFTPVIALTNRTHTDYEMLIKKLSLYYAAADE